MGYKILFWTIRSYFDWIPRIKPVCLFKKDSWVTYNPFCTSQSIGYQFDNLTIFRKYIKRKLYTINLLLCGNRNANNSLYVQAGQLFHIQVLQLFYVLPWVTLLLYLCSGIQEERQAELQSKMYRLHFLKQFSLSSSQHGTEFSIRSISLDIGNHLRTLPMILASRISSSRLRCSLMVGILSMRSRKPLGFPFIFLSRQAVCRTAWKAAPTSDPIWNEKFYRIYDKIDWGRKRGLPHPRPIWQNFL